MTQVNFRLGRRISAAALLAATGVAFFAGRMTQPDAAHAADGTPPTSDYSNRIVAHLYNGRVPITREMLGEYLIARLGYDRVELLVNKTIIETACKEKGIEVTAAEVEAAFQQDLAGVTVDRKAFVENVLKQYGKTEYEWREDVLKPRLQLTKLCKLQIQVTDEEIKQAFDAEFGQRVEGRVVIWPKQETRSNMQIYEELRKSEAAFDAQARQQAVSHLAASGGRIKPFGRGAGTHPELERQAFQLKPGEMTSPIETNEGWVVFKLDQILPPDSNAKLEQHRERLSRQVYDKKLSQEIPKQFKHLREAANPRVLLRKSESAEEIEQTTKQLLQTGATQPKK